MEGVRHGHGANLLDKLDGQRRHFGELNGLAQFAKVWLFVLIPLFLIAGLLEGLVTPLIVRALYG